MNVLDKYRPKVPPLGYVYIIKNGNNYKIGKTSKDPKLRLKQLTLGEVGEIIYTAKYYNYSNIEKELHLLAQYQRIGKSEWFDSLNEDILLILTTWKESEKIL